jgi:hypothetical protein
MFWTGNGRCTSASSTFARCCWWYEESEEVCNQAAKEILGVSELKNFLAQRGRAPVSKNTSFYTWSYLSHQPQAAAVAAAAPQDLPISTPKDQRPAQEKVTTTYDPRSTILQPCETSTSEYLSLRPFPSSTRVVPLPDILLPCCSCILLHCLVLAIRFSFMLHQRRPILPSWQGLTSILLRTPQGFQIIIQKQINHESKSKDSAHSGWSESRNRSSLPSVITQCLLGSFATRLFTVGGEFQTASLSHHPVVHTNRHDLPDDLLSCTTDPRVIADKLLLYWTLGSRFSCSRDLACIRPRRLHLCESSTTFAYPKIPQLRRPLSSATSNVVVKVWAAYPIKGWRRWAL